MGTRTNTTSRRSRYARSSTVSVTQLLQDSCSSLLSRLTSRVRGPSAAADREPIEPPRRLHRREKAVTQDMTRLRLDDKYTTAQDGTRSRLENTYSTGQESTRSRLEDKYSSAQDVNRSRLEDKHTNAQESARSRLEDKYSATQESSRSRLEDKYRYSRRRDREYSGGQALAKSATTHTILLSEKAYPYVNSTSVVREKTPYRTERHRRQQTEASQHKLRPLRTELGDSLGAVSSTGNGEGSPAHDRQARRKEIQSLILKYTGLEDSEGPATSALARCQQKYSSYLSAKHRVSNTATITPSASALPLTLPLPLVSLNETSCTHALVQIMCKPII